MKSSIFLILIFSCVLSFAKPQVIPEIKEWTTYDSTLIINQNFEIIYNFDQKAELEQLSNTFSEDIQSLKKWNFKIKANNSSSKNSIFFKIDPSISDNEEFYQMEINDRIEIIGKTPKAVFWGTRTILQMLKSSESLECGKIEDFPDYKERGLMIDLGRRYHSIQWLENHIRDLSYLKMNLFHFHLSDNEGFRLECQSYPQITSKDHYTKQQMLDLQKLAKKYFVDIIPEIDMPSHMGAILTHFPDLQLMDSIGNSAGACCLDFTKLESRKLVENIIKEYIDIFEGRYWHFGADEYYIDYNKYPHVQKWAEDKYGVGATPEDAYFDFINWANNMVKSKNKKLRVWNDWSNDAYGKNTKTFVDKDVTIDYWAGNYPASKFLVDTFATMNCSVKFLYYVLANPFVNNEMIFDQWNVNNFSSFNEEIIVEDKQNILGAKFHVWNDVPGNPTENEYQTANTIKKVLRIVALKTWYQDHKIDTFKIFNNLITKIGRAPGYIEPESPVPYNLAYKKAIYASSSEPKSEDLYPEMANDGDYTTRWASNLTDSEWIYVDFGEKTKFTTVRLNWEYAYATDYAIQISDDAINWTDIYFTNKGKGSFEIIDDLNSEARYLKIDCRKRVAWNGYSLWEFEVYDSNAIDSSYDPVDNNDIMLFPNPATDYITINIAAINPTLKRGVEGELLIEIYDVIGILVAQTSSSVFNGQTGTSDPPRIDISNLAPGIYFLKIVGSNGASSIVEKFVKM